MSDLIAAGATAPTPATSDLSLLIAALAPWTSPGLTLANGFCSALSCLTLAQNAVTSPLPPPLLLLPLLLLPPHAPSAIAEASTPATAPVLTRIGPRFQALTRHHRGPARAAEPDKGSQPARSGSSASSLSSVSASSAAGSESATMPAPA